ncbi:VWA domain-containing protein [Candidatus Bathyarchaeota archaeon]|nr:VWA domain-containing protein [Candidatus Bathyarchaeota archaeon]
MSRLMASRTILSLRFGGDEQTILEKKAQMRVIEAMIACLLLIAGLSATTYLSRVNVSVDEGNLKETGENIFDVLCQSEVIQRIMIGGEFTESQLKTLISTLLPPDCVFTVSFGSSLTNDTLMNATNMGSGLFSSYNAFSGIGTFTISLPLSQVEYQPVDVMLVMDVSGSMGETDDSGKIKLDLAKNASKTFVDQLNMSRDRVGLVSFSTDATLRCNLINDTTTIKSQIDALNASGYTNIGGGISKANDEFVNCNRSKAVWVMILLSDGKANRPCPHSPPHNNNCSYAREYAINQSECSKTLKGKGVRIYTIGLGSTDNIDEELMKQIATDESKYYHAPTADQLESIYIAISKDILLQVRYDIVIIQLNILGSG